jgi:2-polyprenyl-3-methyl-5-hydroxy-6-metoxy-1,4-benzoquinol methylase
VAPQDLRIGIVVVAYNAGGTLAGVLDRIPDSFRPRITEILVGDDCSQDSTYLVGLGYKAEFPDLPLTVIRHPRNLGYGGNQKASYSIAAEHGLDVVVLLHGDGQYAPELLPDMVGPIERGDADVVLGSRMMMPGAARRGGMPLHKRIGNRVLTTFENRMVGTELSEYHSGYRAYRIDALRSVPLERNSDSFDFDTQILIQLHHARKRIVEIPIPTFYGDEISRVNGLRYARQVSAEAARYRLAQLGLGSGPRCLGPDPFTTAHYELKEDEESSHGQLLAWLDARPPGRVLDLGCSSGLLAERVRKLGYHVVGVDIEELAGVEGRVDQFVRADLDQGIPDAAGHDFDVVLAADVIEHHRQPDLLLRQSRDRLAPDGVLLLSVPNFGHWYPRLRTAAGRFDYDRRGILDSGHLRFFTKKSIERSVHDAGFTIRRRAVTGLPISALGGDGSQGSWRTLGRADRAAAELRPQLFAYQLLYELAPEAEEPLVSGEVSIGTH